MPYNIITFLEENDQEPCEPQSCLQAMPSIPATTSSRSKVELDELDDEEHSILESIQSASRSQRRPTYRFEIFIPQQLVKYKVNICYNIFYPLDLFLLSQIYNWKERRN